MILKILFFFIVSVSTQTIKASLFKASTVKAEKEAQAVVTPENKKAVRISNQTEKNHSTSTDISTNTKPFNSTNKSEGNSEVAIEIAFLENTAQTKNSQEIHNKALEFLKNNQKAQALMLLKRNVYQNLFIPSYLVLSHLEFSISLTPFLWHISLFFLTLLALYFIISYFKKPQASQLGFLLSLFIIGLILSSGLFFLKQRVGLIYETSAKSSPFESATTSTKFSPSSELMVLKRTKGWLRVKNLEGQTGWLKKEQVFQIF